MVATDLAVAVVGCDAGCCCLLLLVVVVDAVAVGVGGVGRCYVFGCCWLVLLSLLLL